MTSKYTLKIGRQQDESTVIYHDVR